MLLEWRVKEVWATLLFQWAPTLGGECYTNTNAAAEAEDAGFNGHPPLGVNATYLLAPNETLRDVFQWAPTLGGECYGFARGCGEDPPRAAVSMGTHPWG